MLFLAEYIRIFTLWQAIPFKRKFLLKLKSGLNPQKNGIDRTKAVHNNYLRNHFNNI